MEILIYLILGAIGWSFLKRLFGGAGSGQKKIVDSTYQKPKYNFTQRRTSRKYMAIEKPKVTLSDEAQNALQHFENSNDNIFLTGRAGTGKSTLLQYFRATTKKKAVFLAYTGVAAVNIQGQTIHSFFGFPPGITENRVRKIYNDRANLYRKLDTVVIDEASMLRADFFDCIEKFLRLNGPNSRKPFGGVQMILIGDLYQLPPIVKDDERKIFNNFYPSEFFFDSKCYKAGKFSKIQLSYVYRQADDPDFIKILDAVRVCAVKNEHIKKLNEHCVAPDQSSGDDFQISLAPTNTLVKSINDIKLAQLQGRSQSYFGSVSGEFKEKEFPTAKELSLKEGAQVMLLNNDPRGRWINGDLAKVAKLDDATIRVIFEDGSYDDVAPHKWERIRFVYDDENNEIKSEITGTFTQLPVRLAWAVTIHKGQGKTFDKVNIDFGNGTFASGQAYVALSRCRSLAGLSLKTPLKKEHIFVDSRIHEFMEKHE